MGGIKIKSRFENQLDAAKEINQLCEEMRIPLKNPELLEISNQQVQKKEKASQCNGFWWNKKKKKWQSQLRFSEGKLKYGVNFNDWRYAAKKWDELCEEMEISSQNSEISTMPTQKKQMKNLEQLFEEMRIFSRKIIPTQQSYQIKNLEQLFEEMIISSQNPEIYAMPTEPYQKRENTSQYKGVYWSKEREKWYVQLFLNAKRQYGGFFNDERDAAKRVNELCEKWGIPPQNPAISAMSTQQYQKREKTSQYHGVYWHAESGKWYANLSLKSGKKIYGGIFDDELDAAKKVNELCEGSKSPRKQNFSFVFLPPINSRYENHSHFTPEKNTVTFHYSTKINIVEINPKIIEGTNDVDASEIKKLMILVQTRMQKAHHF